MPRKSSSPAKKAPSKKGLVPLKPVSPFCEGLLESLGDDPSRVVRYCSSSLATLSLYHSLPYPAPLDSLQQKCPPRTRTFISAIEQTLLTYHPSLPPYEPSSSSDYSDEDDFMSESESEEDSEEEESEESEEEEEEEDEEDGSEASSIDHNDRCEACEEVGDLICCDTCNLVFHLECIRPAQKVVPRGQWNCAYCMERGVGIGHVKKNRLKEVVRIAEKAVRQYEEAKKTKGIASNYVPREIPLSVTIGSGGRSSPPKKMSPIGKILPPSSTKLSPSSNSPSQIRMRSPVRAQDLNKSPLETNKPSPSAKRGPGRPPKSTITSPGPEVCTSPPPQATEDSRKLRPPIEPACELCLDYKSIRVCTSCACQICHAKHSQSQILLCDHCDKEYHMSCLTPPLLNVPTGEWFCSTCKGADVVSRSGRKVIKKFPRNGVDEANAPKKRKKRGPGRWPKQKTTEGEVTTSRERVDSTGQIDSDSADFGSDALMSGASATSPNFKSSGSNVDRSRKPGGRECLHLLRRSDGNPMGNSQITQIWDYASRGKGEQLRILKDAVDALHDGIVDFFAKSGKKAPAQLLANHSSTQAAVLPFNPTVKLYSQVPAVAEPFIAPSKSAPPISTLAAVAPAPSLLPVHLKEEEKTTPSHYQNQTTSIAGVENERQVEGDGEGARVGGDEYSVMANPSKKRKSHDGGAVPALAMNYSTHTGALPAFAPSGGVLGSLSPESQRGNAGTHQVPVESVTNMSRHQVPMNGETPIEGVQQKQQAQTQGQGQLPAS
ncbi:hypothetical protein TrVE_jg8682 [Triparma verrucosa]|uniref:PHD-type domain-containing protein n=2 Tax=Triparma TaxID=722752 RepID=A0A9W7ARF8_9STRA|nr:hypothetical protein TrST_g9469 [Triparma strigata]GMH81220.1 hypothetical protein TrVE_jg8682 [Triparma verrucosa]